MSQNLKYLKYKKKYIDLKDKVSKENILLGGAKCDIDGYNCKKLDNTEIEELIGKHNFFSITRNEYLFYRLYEPINLKITYKRDNSGIIEKKNTTIDFFKDNIIKDFIDEVVHYDNNPHHDKLLHAHHRVNMNNTRTFLINKDFFGNKQIFTIGIIIFTIGKINMKSNMSFTPEHSDLIDIILIDSGWEIDDLNNFFSGNVEKLIKGSKHHGGRFSYYTGDLEKRGNTILTYYITEGSVHIFINYEKSKENLKLSDDKFDDYLLRIIYKIEIKVNENYVTIRDLDDDNTYIQKKHNLEEIILPNDFFKEPS